MKPINFPGVNIIYAEDQPEYIPLPTIRFPRGETIQCWEFTPENIEEINRTGRLFVGQWTFGQRLQPISVTMDKAALYPEPYEEYKAEELKLNERLLLWDPKGREYYSATVIVNETKFFQLHMGDYGIYNLIKGMDYVELINFKVVAKIKP
jgi:hypothetical protein